LTPLLYHTTQDASKSTPDNTQCILTLENRSKSYRSDIYHIYAYTVCVHYEEINAFFDDNPDNYPEKEDLFSYKTFVPAQ